MSAPQRAADVHPRATGVTSEPAPRAHGGYERELLHPYSYLLFLGADERGDMIPTKALRERYSQPRVDVYPPSSSDGGDE